MNCNGRIIIPTELLQRNADKHRDVALLLLYTSHQDYHKGKKVAIDRWGCLMEAITLNNCCVGMGCIAFCLTVKEGGQV
jgi:hypothetical protein